ncbi:MAG: RrF2 family transcriptional regulator [Oscillospiraceae bacterium]|nr:RrF2 family transcriptional regulator [Oscillospiraceae bacterium]
MMISTKGRYALNILLDLSQHADEGYISLKKISQRQKLPIKYLEAIVSVLNKSGMVESLRGKEGGYRLTKKPEDYTIGSIIKLAEGSIAPVSCLESENCAQACHCLTLPLWMKLEGLIDAYLESVTLKDLLEQKIS